MPSRRNANSNPEVLSPEAKIARLMALGAIKEVENTVDRVVFLRSAGFSNSEIADLLNISGNHVAVAIVSSRKKKRKRSS
jgi:DNA-directed RNA polymerase specialized sigma24 family protein